MFTSVPAVTSMIWAALRFLFPAALALALLSCGEGGGVGSGGTGLAGSGSQFGAINGFGSVIVESNRYDDTGAAVSIEIDPSNPRVVTSADLRLGMQVHVTFDANERALSIRAVAAVAGLVESLSASSLRVAGQTVQLDSSGSVPLVLDGVATVAELAVGDRVVVYGQTDQNDRVLATRLERVAATVQASTRVSGLTSAVAGDGSSFTIGGLTIGVNSGTVRQPAGLVLAVGQRITVSANANASSGALTASLIKLDSESAQSEQPWRTSGPVRDLNLGSKRFGLADAMVDYSAASFVDGTSADLANGRVVRVRGVSRAGILVASEVRFVTSGSSSGGSSSGGSSSGGSSSGGSSSGGSSSGGSSSGGSSSGGSSSGDSSTPEVERTDTIGTVTDFVSSSSFRVRGTLHSLLATAEIRGGAITLLRDGAKVRVRGLPAGNVIQVERLEFLD